MRSFLAEQLSRLETVRRAVAGPWMGSTLDAELDRRSRDPREELAREHQSASNDAGLDFLYGKLLESP